MMRLNLGRIFAWSVLVAVVVMTIGPVELRLSTGLPLKVERFAGFALVSAIFVVAYPRRWPAILLSFISIVLVLEALQILTPGRHGSKVDALVKIGGTVFGTLTAALIVRGRGRNTGQASAMVVQPASDALQAKAAPTNETS